ncbi:hypothetical protein [Dokdonella immobilis]|uniref:Response regulator receiver domain-containing protein n=1 Tax=Dokdonella immobilis TaxID=578942 RepID=A0A1I4X2X7_9GAMM|nr:hypothetical protein [Dokdonella immobilis]SFN20002.1 hypothetical protein SAMN05216289_10776 [Dokdonella immobilis]
MDTCHILIVEDNPLTIEGWERDIRDFNRRSEKAFEFRQSFATNKREALQKLSRQRFDCAVVDLRLPISPDEQGTGEPVGNDVLHGVLRDLGIPAWVYSGYESEVSEEIKASNIKVARKEGGATAAILEDFEKQAGLMDAMDQMRCKVAQETSLLFNRSIWPRWEKRWAKREDRELIKGIITRQTVAHVAEALSQAPSHHPDEFYVVPALYEDRLETGDILTHEAETLIVLTPRCNLANNKLPTKIMFAVCAPCDAWARWQGNLGGPTKVKERAEDDIGKHATQGHAIATHFMPPLETRGPWLVDFRELRVVDSSKVNELLQHRIATVAPQFLANLVQRHAAYLGRIGQPEIDATLLIDLCQAATHAPVNDGAA